MALRGGSLPRARFKLGLACAAAVAAAGCSMNSSVFDSDAYSSAFSKPFKAFDAPEWATGRSTANIRLGPSGPVAPEDMVSADGHCALEAAPAGADAPPNRAPAAAAPGKPSADPPAGSLAGDLASAPTPAGASPPPGTARMDRLEPDAAAPPAPAFNGGVALGMTECQVVRRAGAPSNVSVGANEKGERKVVLSYLQGNWPGIYQFESGRLKTIDAAPVPDKPVKPAPKKHPKKKPAQAARHDIERVYVQ
jgi:hypothetical protein